MVGILPGRDARLRAEAIVIALAHAFAKAGGAPRTLVFVAFGGEEMGLLGSAHYVKQPAWPIERTTLMHPNNQQIVFSSNLHDPTGRSFALYLVNVDGSGLERLTWAESFASFPMFSRDGRRLVFTANCNAAAPREQNVFVSDWNP